MSRFRKAVLLYVLFVFYAPFSRAQTQKQSVLYQMVQQHHARIKPSATIQLFQQANPNGFPAHEALFNQHAALQLNWQAGKALYQQQPSAISISIPATEQDFTLELIQEDIAGGKVPVGLLTGNGSAVAADSSAALHYRGYVIGYPNSIAAISIFSNGQVMGIFATPSGNYTIGQVAAAANQYICYNSKQVKAPLSFTCSADQLPAMGSGLQQPYYPAANINPLAAPPLLCKKVRIYWEASYKLYANNFSRNLSNTSNYLTGLLNQLAVLYLNEGIIIEVAQVNIWTTTDPYTTNTSANALETLKTRWNGLGNNFRGDLCMLIDGAPTNNGGLAYILVNDYCNRTYAYGYANIYAQYNAVPVYSWDIQVLAHELGHLLGSQHTHWCGWNTGVGGACGAIDDCYPVEAFNTCTTCPATTTTNPPPSGFEGTIMSYCYLRNGIGVNFTNGFGPLPQAAIRNSINSALCPVLDNKWTGAASTAWSNTANWSCGSLPNDKTDVTIPAGLTNYPVVSSAAVCRKLIQKPNTTVRVNTGFSLRVAGTN